LRFRLLLFRLGQPGLRLREVVRRVLFRPGHPRLLDGGLGLLKSHRNRLRTEGRKREQEETEQSRNGDTLDDFSCVLHAHSPFPTGLFSVLRSRP